MVGRNNQNDAKEADTVYLVGSDRISTELHNLGEDANADMKPPMKLDYVMNDPADPEQVYYRSDHYSYAVKGVPIIFYFDGVHEDYHRAYDFYRLPHPVVIAVNVYRQKAHLALDTGS